VGQGWLPLEKMRRPLNWRSESRFTEGFGIQEDNSEAQIVPADGLAGDPWKDQPIPLINPINEQLPLGESKALDVQTSDKLIVGQMQTQNGVVGIAFTQRSKKKVTSEYV
jgi:hypothetical protein